MEPRLKPKSALKAKQHNLVPTLNSKQLSALMTFVDRLESIINNYHSYIEFTAHYGPERERTKSTLRKICRRMEYNLINIDKIKKTFPENFFIMQPVARERVHSITCYAYYCIVKNGVKYRGTTDYKEIMGGMPILN